MPSTQSFGGRWTEEKLARLGKYLRAYRHIFSGNAQARHLKTWYVDAFAGSGERGEGDDVEEMEFRRGSAILAVALDDPFDRYLFIDKLRRRVNELKANVEEAAGDRIERCTFDCGDANELLLAWSRKRDWSRERAVVFLDPYGAQVNWETVAALAATKAVDLWYLFPLSAVLRMLRKDGAIPAAWKQRLTGLLGRDNWEQAFYEPERQMGLFGVEASLERTATPASVCRYLQERLKSEFPFVQEKQLILMNSKNSPMFSLCFAAANPKSGAVAIKIAGDILGKID